MKKLLRIYQEKCGSRFFLRLMSIYSIIIVIMSGIMAILIAKAVKESLTDQAIYHNMQVLESINARFNLQNRNFKKILSGLYSGNIKGGAERITAVSAIEELFDPAVEKELTFLEKIDARHELNTYFVENSLPIDTDISDILVISPSEQILNVSRRGYGTDWYKRIAGKTLETAVDNINERRVRFLSAGELESSGDFPRLYVIYDYIRKSGDTSRYNGILAAVYDLDIIKNVYNQRSPYLLGDILILSEDGQIIFDSSEQYDDSLKDKLGEIERFHTGTQKVKNNIVNIVSNSEFGFYVVSFISDNDLAQYAGSLNMLIGCVCVFCVCLILFLGYVSTKRLFKRILSINNTLVEIEKGNMGARAVVSGANDEIKQIALNLNRMSEKLQEYIQREYQARLDRTNAELKQKTAELYALQAQINPHFLYNTLETIRMSAVNLQDKETADMIKNLARMFREGSKESSVVTIREELDYCRAYLSLLNIRYQGRLTVEYNIEPDIMDCAVLRHLIQPIVENSIVHGMEWSRRDNSILLEGHSEDQSLVISISDNGKGIPAARLAQLQESLKNSEKVTYEKIGLHNVQNRIRMIYKEPYGIEIQSKEGFGTKVDVRLLKLSREELQKNVYGDDRG